MTVAMMNNGTAIANRILRETAGMVLNVGYVERKIEAVSALTDGKVRQELLDAKSDLASLSAKLRELVKDMWDFYCAIPDEPHASNEEIDFSVEALKRMHELGIDVDE